MPFKAIGRALGLGPQKTSTFQSSTPTRPAEVEAASRDLIARAQSFAAQPFEAYGGQRFAGFTPDELAAFQTTRDIAAESGALAPLSGDLVREGVAAARRLATTLPETDISGYMSPYTESVLDPAIRDITERAAQERLRLGQQAGMRGAFGGSRQAIAESELERGTQRSIGDLSARERAAAYNQALQQFRLDQERIPALYSGALGQVGQGIGIAGQRLGTEVNPLLQTGGAQRALDQAGLDFAYQQFQEERDFPLRGIEVLRSALGVPGSALGIGTQSQGQTKEPGPNPLAQILGTTMNAPAIMKGAGAIGAGISSLFPFLSDERMKTDIQELGPDPETGVMMYAFRYEGDPKTYPKVVGPLAQDIEEAYPEAVADVAGYKAVRTDFPAMQRGALS